MNLQPEKHHKGWHSRGYLPHLDNPTLVQMVAFRLADSMPASMVTLWKELLGSRHDPELWAKVEKYLDAGHGACHLQEERIARQVEQALLHFDGARYRLLAWVIMPNHVHVLFETLEGHLMGDVVHSWKSFTANQANKLLGRKGEFWQPDYFDRYMRSEEHLLFSLAYIHENPVRAGLAVKAEHWPWSSARFTG